MLKIIYVFLLLKLSLNASSEIENYVAYVVADETFLEVRRDTKRYEAEVELISHLRRCI